MAKSNSVFFFRTNEDINTDMLFARGGPGRRQSGPLAGGVDNGCGPLALKEYSRGLLLFVRPKVQGRSLPKTKWSVNDLHSVRHRARFSFLVSSILKTTLLNVEIRTEWGKEKMKNVVLDVI
ncbi:hypothetical protein WA026_017509 [Henosepilachna vigintioctopunctata]|uniref:Uncharacterized protein n=1 Tax=Henosepilachna vigintioctopunctata TaxID=420089 RepID=A0AAW1V2Y4_9CUCU